MSVYGEEFIPVDFSKGLWLSDHASAIPDGYCHRLTNLIINDVGHAEARPMFNRTLNQGISGILESNITKIPNTSPPPEWWGSSFIKSWSFSPVGVNDPMIFMQAQTTSPNATFLWLRDNYNSTYQNTYADTNCAEDMTQYRDRFYAINKAGTGVVRWTFGAGTITFNTLVTLPLQCNTILAFRDRIFASANNRIYFTDRASSGGYPESWNSGNNFISMPSLGSTIMNMIAHNDRIFIFTDRGLYQLSAIGDSSSWSVALVSADIQIFSKNSVALVKDNFVYHDFDNVYITTGLSYPQAIGNPIRAIFRDSVARFENWTEIRVISQTFSGIRILPWEDGFILTCQAHDSSGGFWNRSGSTYHRHIYFNGSSWSEIEFTNDGDPNNGAIVNIHKKQRLAVTPNEPFKKHDIILEIRRVSTSPVTYDIVVYSTRKSQEHMTPLQGWGYVLTTKIITPSPASRIARIKYGLSKVRLTLGSMQYSLSINGGQQTLNVTQTNTGNYYHSHKFSGFNVDRSMDFQINIVTNWETISPPGTNQYLLPWPPFRVESLGVMANTDQRTQTDTVRSV